MSRVSTAAPLWLAVFAAVTLLRAQGTPTDGLALHPVDEATAEPALAATRTAAIVALQRRDSAALLQLAAEDIGFLSSKSRGKISLANGLFATLHDTPVSELMLTALNLGGSFTTTRGSAKGQREFCAPYIYSAFPRYPTRYIRKDDEPIEFDPWVLIGKDVAVRRQRGLESPVVARLSYRLVFITPPSIGDVERGLGWYGVTTAEGIHGYVHPSLVKNPRDLHVCFGIRDGEWKITEIDERYPTD